MATKLGSKLSIVWPVSSAIINSGPILNTVIIINIDPRILNTNQKGDTFNKSLKKLFFIFIKWLVADKTADIVIIVIAK